jgi:hypothetical protein
MQGRQKNGPVQKGRGRRQREGEDDQYCEIFSQ